MNALRGLCGRFLRSVGREVLAIEIACLETLLSDLEQSGENSGQLATELRGKIALGKAMLASDKFNAA